MTRKLLREPGRLTKIIDKVADLLNIPKEELYDFMGWMDTPETEKVEDLVVLRKLAGTDEKYDGLVQEYSAMSPDERRQFIRIMKAWLDD